MTLKNIYLRQIILAALVIISYQPDVFSQETEIVTAEKPGFFIGINFGPSQSQIINTGTPSVSNLHGNKKISFFGSMEFGYYFSKYFGLSTGIGINSYNTDLTLDSYQNKVSSIDSEADAYELQVSGNGIKEKQQVDFLTIPVCLNFRIPLSKSISFFVQPGVNMAIPIIKNYQSSGTFTYKGYYPQYNVLLENLPAYGFPGDLVSATKGEFKLKSYSLSAFVSAGCDFFISEKIQIAIAGSYDKSILSVSNYSSPDNFHLTTEANQINSLMGGSSKTITQSMGVKIIFRYYLKLKKVEKLPTPQVN